MNRFVRYGRRWRSESSGPRLGAGDRSLGVVLDDPDLTVGDRDRPGQRPGPNGRGERCGDRLPRFLQRRVWGLADAGARPGELRSALGGWRRADEEPRRDVRVPGP